MSLNRERDERGGREGGREGGRNTVIKTFLQQSGEVRMTIVRKQECTTSRIAQLFISLPKLKINKESLS